MWTDTTRRQFARSSLRLPSDLTDAEWLVLEPLFPARSHRGRPPVWSYRQIVETLLYLLRSGLPWRMLPPDLFPPITTVQHYFYRWRDIGLWRSINETLLMAAREAAGREASPSAGVIDSQSVKTVRRQNIWRKLGCGLAGCRPRLGFEIRRRVCGAASADVRWSFV